VQRLEVVEVSGPERWQLHRGGDALPRRHPHLQRPQQGARGQRRRLALGLAHEVEQDRRERRVDLLVLWKRSQARWNCETMRFSSLRGSPVSAVSWLLRGRSKRGWPSTDCCSDPGICSVSMLVRPPSTVWS
jgi:hypothetical protein